MPTRKTRWLLGSLVLVFLCGSPSLALDLSDNQWEFLYAEDGIKMFAGIDTPLPTYKAEGTIPVNVLELLAVIADVSHRKEWLTDISLSRILEGNIESRVVIYERLSMPGPISDRDCVVESVIEKDFDRGVVTVRYRQVNHPKAPPVRGYVRMPVIQGLMRYSFQDAGHTTAVYETTLDIGGSLPQWLIKLAIKKVPIFTLKALIKQVERTRGRYREFVQAQRSKIKFSY